MTPPKLTRPILAEEVLRTFQEQQFTRSLRLAIKQSGGDPDVFLSDTLTLRELREILAPNRVRFVHEPVSSVMREPNLGEILDVVHHLLTQHA